MENQYLFKKNGRFWEYEESLVVKMVKEDANKYESFNKMCIKNGCAPNSNPIRILSKKYSELISNADWNYAKNNPRYKAKYQDKEYLRCAFFEKGMTIKEIADECDCTTRVIEKWLVEVNEFKNLRRLETVELSDVQRSIVIGSLLGDGHIDKRFRYPLFVVSHAENQKDYLYWKYNIFKNLCNKPPLFVKGGLANIMGSMCNRQDSYRMVTRSYKAFSNLRELGKLQVIELFDELALSIWMLDDGHNDGCTWGIYYDQFTRDEKIKVVDILYKKFGINGYERKSDDRYLHFKRDSLEKINNIILRNIPNDLDVMYKLFNKEVDE